MDQRADTSPNEYAITLLRHAESIGNAERIHQGQSHHGLTDKGREQAQHIVNSWLESGKSYDHIISSPLPRALQTAQIIADAYHLPIQLEPDWQERDNGLLAGLKIDEVAEIYSPPSFISLYEPIGKTGESIWQLYLRAGRVVQSLVRQSPGSYLIVSHGGILDMVLHAILGMLPQPNFMGWYFRFDNCSFSELIYKRDTKHWSLIRHNTNSPSKTIGRCEAIKRAESHPHRLQFVFLRHGESKGNKQGVIQGQTDFELTTNGIQQANQLAQTWRSAQINFDQIITSPLSRAKNTAQIIASQLNCPLTILEEWMERDFGSLTGTRGEMIWSHLEMRGFFHPYQPVGETGESQWDLYLRAGKAIIKLLEKPTGKYLVVAHGGILNMTLRVIFGISPQRNQIPPRFHYSNTAYARIFFDPAKQLWGILGLNEQVITIYAER